MWIALVRTDSEVGDGPLNCSWAILVVNDVKNCFCTKSVAYVAGDNILLVGGAMTASSLNRIIVGCTVGTVVRLLFSSAINPFFTF